MIFGLFILSHLAKCVHALYTNRYQGANNWNNRDRDNRDRDNRYQANQDNNGAWNYNGWNGRDRRH